VMHHWLYRDWNKIKNKSVLPGTEHHGRDIIKDARYFRQVIWLVII